MRRVFGFVMVLGLLAGAAGCSSSGSDKKADSPAAETGDKGSTSDSGNAKVDDYCKAVDSFVTKAKAAQSDPAKAQALTADSQDLAKKAQALATGLSAEDAQKVADCTKKSTDALMPG